MKQNIVVDISDKTCDYIYEYDDYICSICYELKKLIEEESCVFLSKDSTREQDDITIRNYIEYKLGEDYILKDVNVNVRDEVGRRL